MHCAAAVAPAPVHAVQSGYSSSYGWHACGFCSPYKKLAKRALRLKDSAASQQVARKSAARSDNLFVYISWAEGVPASGATIRSGQEFIQHVPVVFAGGHRKWRSSALRRGERPRQSLREGNFFSEPTVEITCERPTRGTFVCAGHLTPGGLVLPTHRAASS